MPSQQIVNSIMNELETTKKQLEIRRLHRYEKLEIIEDYLGFATAKMAGASLMLAGVVEVLSPEIIQAVLPEPAGLVGVGFALLAGRKAVRLLEKVVEVLKK